MPELPAALLGSRESQEAHRDCRQLTGSCAEEGVTENTAQHVQPKEEVATLLT